LKEALRKAIDFVSFFVHPDGTFAGEYGSRRTSVFYPGGLALLSRDFPLALGITRFMLHTISEGHTTTLTDVDIGNLAPLLVNYIAVIDTDFPEASQPPQLLLPWAQSCVCQDFPEAGLYIRGKQRYYAIFGASNGGVLKIFNREKRSLILNDGGYVGQLDRGDYITTQMTHMNSSCQATQSWLQTQTHFYHMLRSVPTPFRFVLLRLLNLTIMRNVRIGSKIKRMLVRFLITGKKTVPLDLTRIVEFQSEQVIITDLLSVRGQITLRWLEFGRPFVGIHMASARYFDGCFKCYEKDRRVDVAALNSNGELKIKYVIEL
jgi:hypothetical protein